MLKVEQLDFFDEQNRFIGRTDRDIIHKNGLYHRSVIIFVFNSEGEIFLQKRSQEKDICPGYWDGGVAGHLRPGEVYSKAASRELNEEIKVNITPEEIRGVHLMRNEYEDGSKDYEFVVTFKACYDAPITANPSEIEESGFFAQEDVENMMARGEKFTPWFLEEWEYLVENNLI